jgi:hypothetical protein
MAAAIAPTSSGTPAEQLEGLALNNGWTVGKPIIRTNAQTGGCFSCAYHVTRANGETAFLKAMDFAAALREPDPAKALNELTSAFLFERSILEECADRKMSRIVRAIDGGITAAGGSGVQYLIFEEAKGGDLRKHLKSGCRAEEAKLRTAERLVNLIAILTILSWRIFWITMLNRTRHDAAPTEAFTELDQYLLDELVPNKGSPPAAPSLGHYIVKLARLGGYLARAHDPPPGNTVIWRGLSRLTDIELGIMIGAQLVGN